MRTIRDKQAWHVCEKGAVIAQVPPQQFERRVARPGLVAQVVASTYADHLLLCPQGEIAGIA